MLDHEPPRMMPPMPPKVGLTLLEPQLCDMVPPAALDVFDESDISGAKPPPPPPNIEVQSIRHPFHALITSAATNMIMINVQLIAVLPLVVGALAFPCPVAMVTGA